MENIIIKSTLLGLLASIAFTGCISPAPNLDSHFGEAVNAAKAQQTINPDASLNTDPVVGMDGKAADATVDRYHKSFERQPATTNVFTIGVGGSGGSSGGGAK